MRNSVFNALALGMLMIFAAGRASATTLATTSQALGGWQGTVNFSAVGVLGHTLNSTVEYAVFGGGAFQDFLDENGILYNEPAAGEYVYAYQLVSISATNPGITTFTVGLNGNESLGATGVKYVPLATNHGTYSPLPANNPTAVGGGPGVSTSSQWMYFGSLTNGEASGILYYSSPHPPEMGLTVLSSTTATQSLASALPNPVPEPASMVLLACSALLLTSSHIRRMVR